MVASAMPRVLATDVTPDAASPEFLSVETTNGPVRLTRHGDFASVAGLWRRFELEAVRGHAQTFDWMEAWHRLVDKPAGAEACIVVGTDQAGGTLCIWPFSVERRGGLRTLSWISQEHANYNMGLYRRAFAANLSAADVGRMLAAAARLAGVSLARFTQQPLCWQGLDNPLAKLAHQASPSAGHAVTLGGDFEQVFGSRFGKATRTSLRRKERKLASFGTISYGWALSAEHRRDLLETFLAQKADWFAAAGIADAFADSRHRAFYQAMSSLEETSSGRLQLGFMTVGDEVAATLIGVIHDGRFTVLLSSIIGGDLRRWSPGLLLMREQIKDICGRGLGVYDLGVGENRNKSEWADAEVRLFDSFIGFGAAGRMAALGLAAAGGLKRLIKSQPQLWALARLVRRHLRGHAEGSATPRG